MDTRSGTSSLSPIPGKMWSTGSTSSIYSNLTVCTMLAWSLWSIPKGMLWGRDSGGSEKAGRYATTQTTWNGSMEATTAVSPSRCASNVPPSRARRPRHGLHRPLLPLQLHPPAKISKNPLKRPHKEAPIPTQIPLPHRIGQQVHQFLRQLRLPGDRWWQQIEESHYSYSSSPSRGNHEQLYHRIHHWVLTEQ